MGSNVNDPLGRKEDKFFHNSSQRKTSGQQTRVKLNLRINVTLIQSKYIGKLMTSSRWHENIS